MINCLINPLNHTLNHKLHPKKHLKGTGHPIPINRLPFSPKDHSNTLAKILQISQTLFSQHSNFGIGSSSAKAPPFIVQFFSKIKEEEICIHTRVKALPHWHLRVISIVLVQLYTLDTFLNCINITHPARIDEDLGLSFFLLRN
ncbi:hypothetical protein DVH24_028732 [Malus domestica]|uniref:Uncharacterized protein n=1 Tax=Malus domestica TaxID=3750 RepID=A0A498IZU2_MALDO|nr:hypothetical protein DVH24_028732 [Malus domestica]